MGLDLDPGSALPLTCQVFWDQGAGGAVRLPTWLPDSMASSS